MNMDLVRDTERYVERELSSDSSGHDWWHVARVRDLAVRIGREEDADLWIVELAALLHDVADYKFSGSEEAGPRADRTWLDSNRAEPQVVEAVVHIIANMSYMGPGVPDAPLSLEGRCVRDADRLDAMGAIGIARAFAFGGHQGRALHEPGKRPELHDDAEAYKRSQGTTINHFYEKLLLLRDRMTTDAGRRLARRRHEFMEAYLSEFFLEWGGDGTESP
jgi:uncharacterized protein